MTLDLAADNTPKEVTGKLGFLKIWNVLLCFKGLHQESFKKERPDVVTHNPRTWEAEAKGSLRVPGQPGLQSEL